MLLVEEGKKMWLFTGSADARARRFNIATEDVDVSTVTYSGHRDTVSCLVHHKGIREWRERERAVEQTPSHSGGRFRRFYSEWKKVFIVTLA